MARLGLCILLFLVGITVRAQEQFSVFFESNKFQLTSTERGKLDKWLAENKKSKILAINGYTDEDGSVGLNDTLAQRRVSNVFDYIKGKLAIREDFKTRSFGKLHKQDAVKANNRKATIYYLLEKDLAKENEILGIKEETKPVKKTEVIDFPSSITVTNPFGKKEEMKLDVVFMKKLSSAKVGEKIVIPNLNFRQATFAVVAESRPRLYELLQVLQANPALKIRLQGHICCSQKDYQDLSTQRAKAVKLFLEHNGIEKSRVSFEGFGVSQPIYPIPEKTEEERAANRRVEVLIVANN